MRGVVARLLAILLAAGAAGGALANPLVKLETDAGPIVLELFEEKAPLTVANFLSYVDDGFYNGTIFHRVIPGFMVQGGGLTFDFVEKETRDPIENESGNGLQNTVGTVAMARTADPNSATSQFYINVANNTHLDESGYTVFGEVREGWETIDAILEVPRGLYREFPHAPNEAVRILRASRLSR